MKDSPIVFATVGGVVVTFEKAPSVGDSPDSSSQSDLKWLKIELHYQVIPPKQAPFLDGVQFKIWVEGLDELAPDAPVPGKGVAVALTGQVDYANLAATREGFGVFFVHPSALARYSTRANGVSDFDRKFNVHVEAYVGGTKVDYFDKRKEIELEWFTRLRPIAGMVYRQDQSPFFLTDVLRYPQIKAPQAP